MLVFQELRGRAVPFREGEVADDPEAGVVVGLQELVGIGPAIEADGKAIGFELSVDFGEGRGQPGIGVVTKHFAAISRPVVGEVGRVGEYEADAFVGSCGRTCKQSALMMVLSVMVVMVSAPLVVEAALCDLAYGQERAGGASDRGNWESWLPARKAFGPGMISIALVAPHASMAVSFEVVGASTKRITDMY